MGYLLIQVITNAVLVFFSNEFVELLLGLRTMCGPFGHSWLKKPKSERIDIELVSFHYWTCLGKLIILVWSNVKLARPP